MNPIKRVRILKITHPIKLNWSRNNLVFLPFIKFQLVFKASIPDFVLSSAIRKNTWIDYIIRIISIAGVATPPFWLATLMILAILKYSQTWFGDPWLPPIIYISPTDDWTANLSQLIWPALAVSARFMTVTLRMTRATVLDVLSEDYIQTARSKGATERTIVVRHALRNACLPIVTL